MTKLAEITQEVIDHLRSLRQRAAECYGKGGDDQDIKNAWDIYRCTLGESAEALFQAAEQREGLRALLKKVEWEGSEEEFMCPLCDGLEGEGHDPGCEWVEAMG